MIRIFIICLCYIVIDSSKFYGIPTNSGWDSACQDIEQLSGLP